MMHNASSAVLAHSWGLVALYAMVNYQLVCLATPETMAHLKNKYGEKHDAYAKQTPHLFIPGVY